jgi:hypothetical protein
MSSRSGPWALRPMEMNSKSSRASPPGMARVDTPKVERHSAVPSRGEENARAPITIRRKCSSLRQRGAVFTSAPKKILTDRVDCAQEGRPRSKTSVRTHVHKINLTYELRWVDAGRQPELSKHCRHSFKQLHPATALPGAWFGSRATAASWPPQLRTSRKWPAQRFPIGP